MMVDLKSYYDSRVLAFGEEQLLEQVGHTEYGKAISADQFHQLTEELNSLLQLNSHDVMLDLACGNGAISKLMALSCRSVCGVDFSAEMINVANQLNGASNIRYIHSDVFCLESSHFEGELFSKVLLYGALQHFKRSELERLLNLIVPFCEEQVLFVLGFIPNQEKKGYFYDTFLKKTKALFYKISGRDLIGTWWSKHEIERGFKSVGMQCQFIDVPKGRYGFPYRFHVVAKR